MTVPEFRDVLAKLDPAELAVLLRELAHELYRRDLARWRVLVDCSDELLDQATFAARGRLLERFIASPPGSRRRGRSPPPA